MQLNPLWTISSALGIRSSLQPLEGKQGISNIWVISWKTMPNNSSCLVLGNWCFFQGAISTQIEILIYTLLVYTDICIPLSFLENYWYFTILHPFSIFLSFLPLSFKTPCFFVFLSSNPLFPVIPFFISPLPPPVLDPFPFLVSAAISGYVPTPEDLVLETADELELETFFLLGLGYLIQ